MKLNRQIILALVIMVATSALYRIMPGRPMGFAPQIAIALFSGSLFASKKQYYPSIYLHCVVGELFL